MIYIITIIIIINITIITDYLLHYNFFSCQDLPFRIL